jgi:hypothetical protein
MFRVQIIVAILVTIQGFGSSIGFMEFLRFVTASKIYALTVLYISQITIGHTTTSKSVTFFTNSCLVAASNSGSSPSSGFPNSQRLQLLPSHSKSSQRLNPSGYLTATQSRSHNYVTTDDQSASLSWCQAASGAQDQIFVTVRQLPVC